MFGEIDYTEDWNKLQCPACHGIGEDAPGYECVTCQGSGVVTQNELDAFEDRLK